MLLYAYIEDRVQHIQMRLQSSSHPPVTKVHILMFSSDCPCVPIIDRAVL